MNCLACQTIAPPATRYCGYCGRRLTADDAVRGSSELAGESAVQDRQYFSALFEQSAVAVAQIDSQSGRFVRINSYYCELLGFTREELLKLDFQTITHPDDLREDLDNMERLRGGGLRTFQMEKRLFRKDRSVILVRLTVVPLWLAGSVPDFHLAIVEDFTHHKAAEAALQASVSRLRAIFDSEPECVKLVDRECRLLDMNPAGLAMIEADSMEAVRGMSLFASLCPEYHEAYRSAVADVFSGAKVRLEFEIVGFQGTRRRIEQHAVGLKDLGGKVTEMVAVARDITERKQADEALRESEERYRGLVELAPDGIAIIEDGRVVYANSTAAALLKAQSPRELLAKVLNEHLHPDDLIASAQRQAAILAGARDIPPHEVRIRRLDGTYLTVEVCAGPCTFHGRPAIQLIARDISTRKQTEQTLATLSFAMNHIGEAAVLIDEFARIHYVNDRACRAWEYSREELLQMSVPDLDPDYPMDRWPDHWFELKRDGSQFFESRHRTKSGRTFNVEVSANYFEHEGRGWNLGLSRDISQRKASEQKLRLMQFSMDRAVDSVLWIAPDATILYANDAACRTLGYAQEELVGRAVPDINPNFSTSEWPAHWKEVRERGSFTFESDQKTRDGRMLKTEVTVNYLQFEGREFNCAMVRDITHRKQVEDQLATLRDQLAHATRLGTLGELASGLAHELNQPLASLHLYARTSLQMSQAESTELRQCLQEISNQSLRAGEIVRRMRSFATRSPSQLAAVDLNDLIHEVLSLLAHDLRRGDTNLTLDLEKPLPKALGDAIQIQQVLVNLIRNALDAMAETASDKRSLSIHSQQDAAGIRVSVSDTGSGISPAIAAKLFQPFQSTKPTGLGLGLAICRTLLESQGGFIAAEPHSGIGATFYFVLSAAIKGN